MLRTHANSTENLSMFGLTVLLAAFAGASPLLVNALAAIHVALRLMFTAIYYAGIGKVGGGIRTIVFSLGLFANLILGIITLITFF